MPVETKRNILFICNSDLEASKWGFTVFPRLFSFNICCIRWNGQKLERHGIFIWFSPNSIIEDIWTRGILPIYSMKQQHVIRKYSCKECLIFNDAFFPSVHYTRICWMLSFVFAIEAATLCFCWHRGRPWPKYCLLVPKSVAWAWNENIVFVCPSHGTLK